MRAVWLLPLALSLACCAPPPAPPEESPPRLEAPPALAGMAGQLTTVARDASPSVVRIHNRTRILKPLGRYLDGLAKSFLQVFNPHPWWEWPYRLLTFPAYLLFGYLDLGSATGSGFFIDADRIVTNAHVIENTAELELHLADGRRAFGEVLQKDPQLDLALIRVVDLKGPPPPPLSFRETAVLPGEPVLAIGYPAREIDERRLRPNPRLTVGLVSAVWVELGNPKTRYVETDAALNPGSSGGPLLSLDGQVVGVCSMIGVGKEDEGYAVPAETVRSAIEPKDDPPEPSNAPPPEDKE